MTARIDQFIPDLNPFDATGAHTIRLQRALHAAGISSDIYVDSAHPDVAHLTRPYATWPDHTEAIVIYQMAIGSPLADRLASSSARVVIDYHNFTPVDFFEVWEPSLVHGSAWGRAQLEVLAPRAVLGLADSAYNESELIAAGCTNTRVAPILLDTTEFDRDLDPTLVDQLQRPHPTWLFVGRIAPNKAQHDIIAALAAHRELHDPTTELRLVGGTSSTRYENALRAYADDLGIADAVHLTGPVSPAELTAHYATADLFCCLSDHEGFCVPLLEAMHHQLPIVAHASTAIPETLGDAGLLLPDKHPATVATAAHRALTDTTLRDTLRHNATRRLAHFHLDNTRTTILDALRPLLGGA